MKKLITLSLTGALLLHFGPATSAVSNEEAKQLGEALTSFGAIKAGNADGSIPPYTGGLTKPPVGFDPKSGVWPDPFSNEKPIVKITAANMAQYADKLTPGTQALLKRFPTYRIDVYKSHRTMHYPDWVLQNTAKNATTAKLTGKVDGDGVEGAFGGIPFPIPKSGTEVMWNNLLSYQRTQIDVYNPGQYLVDAAGNRSQLPTTPSKTYYPHYDRALADKGSGEMYSKLWAQVAAPPTMAGTAFLVNYPINYASSDQQSWVYTPGQRRVRMAPEYRYDTPYAQNGGVLFWDELQLFRGRMDRFDFKLVGRKELYIPYNNYKYPTMPAEAIYGTKHIEGDAVRWELHRVWVVEASLKDGARHAYSKRVFYFDEDTWALVEADGFDQEGKLWRVGLAYTFNYYDGIGGGMFAQSCTYDLQKGSYFSYLSPTANGAPKIFVHDKLDTPALFTPSGLAGTGVR
ncbi:DUF1329 domain-containing protein [Noviherbaspirillum saxi]|uniref:DUF1329 domain-containing protein n=1 Tax=Noviherbaspirillum saxi TaxID=2320863 RepID=A0A3A3FGP9_9BURK|nr:DUF1329 domain-containing protein [Noviherbaspirillum saxi]RJF92350.1 DUF1329 domain-containing protein [Noviherbaspirillum saxi]